MPSTIWSLLRIRTKGLLLALPTLVAVAVIAWILPESIREAVARYELARSLEHFQQLQQRLLTQVVDLESAARGYALTRQSVFLQPYDEALDNIPDLLEQLNAAAGETGIGKETLEVIEPIITRRTEQLLLIVQSTEVSVPGLREQLPLLFVDGKKTMDELRVEMATLDLLTREQLEENNARLLEIRQRVVTLMFAALAVIVLCTLASGVIYQMSVARRISRLEERTRTFAEEDPEASRSRPIGDEIYGLEHSFTRMAERVESRERELAESADHLEGVLQSISEAFVATDPDWLITYLNVRGEMMLNVTRTEAIGRSLWELAPALDGSEVRTALERVPATGQPSAFLVGTPRIDPDLPEDAQTEYELKVYPSSVGVAMLWHPFTHEEPSRFQNSFVRPRQPVAAREQALVRSAHDPIFSLDAQGKFVDLNPAAETLWGRTTRRLRGQLVTTVLAAESIDAVWKALRQALGGEPARLEVTCRDASDQPVPMLWSMTASPDRAQVFCLGHDLVQIKSSERTLRESRDKALEAAKSKSELLTQFSQELRAPITGLVGMCELFRQTELRPDQAEYLDMMLESATRMQQILEGIADYGLATDGKSELQETAFPLLQAIESRILTYTPQVIRKGLRIFLQMQPGFPLKVRVDGKRVLQILDALLQNAIKFTDAGEIEVRLEEFDDLDDRITCRLSVRDTGGGIPESEHDLLFEQQKPGQRGSGVGLAMSQQLAELLDGELGFESQEGVGSLFWIEIPVQVIDRAPEDEAGSGSESRPVWAAVRSAPFRDSLRAWAGWLKRPVELEFTRQLTATPISQRLEVQPLPGMIILESVLVAPQDESPVIQVVQRALSQQCRVLVIGNRLPRLNALGESEANLEVVPEPMTTNAWRYAFGLESLQQRRDPELALPGENGDAQTALVIDDDDVQQKIAEAALMRLGWDFITCDSTGEATEWSKQRRFDLVLIDLGLADGDAFHFARQLRQSERQQDDPAAVIIGMSVRSPHLDARACRDAGMNDCLAKPVAGRNLIRILREQTRVKNGWMAKPPRRSPSIDFRRLEREGDEAMIQETLSEFHREIPAHIAGIREALEKQEIERFREQVQQLHDVLIDLDCKPASVITHRLLMIEPAALSLRGNHLLDELHTELDAIRSAIEARGVSVMQY